ncbi:MAG: glycoside hydrolase [Chloroflexi bacterium]|nr:glycoside hydrolase [Chloroflexota bacterium]
MGNLFQSSVEIILANQAYSGAYLASPSFPNYRYAWFRDGSYVAYAMDLVGYPESAAKFHTWAAGTVAQYADKAHRCIELAQHGQRPRAEDCLHSRFTAAGKEADAEWPNHQLDGFGTWLWSLAEHLQINRKSAMAEDWYIGARLVADYLATLWPCPCYDCWEENGDAVHIYTLAAISGGLRAISPALGDETLKSIAQEIKEFLLSNGAEEGHAVKYVGSKDVDSSLLGLSTPYRLLPYQDPMMTETVHQIEKELLTDTGGLRRYTGDSYYGGGEWIPVTAWLGWYYAELGDEERAMELLNWVTEQADEEGRLPEQVPNSLVAPEMYQPWVDRWGPIAQPLLWSHAKYLILHQALRGTK